MTLTWAARWSARPDVAEIPRSFRSMIPLPHRDPTIFSVPVRWAIRVLAWLAFCVASYMTWHAATGSSVAGCGVGSTTGCDEVLSSSWSMWLSVPVSFFGLACYATLAGFSVLIGLTSPREGRWIDTLVVMLSTVAAGASIWFIALQVFAVGHLCPFCMVIDLCGITLGALALWSAMRSGATTATVRTADAGLMALRATMPSVARVAPLHVPQITARPAIGLALGGAIALLGVLIGGQIIWPSRTFHVEAVVLDKPINMTGAPTVDTTAESDESPTAKTHVAMRVPTESDTGQVATPPTAAGDRDPEDDQASAAPAETESSEPNVSASESTKPAPAEAAPKRKRLVKFLGGKLSFDTYEHPILGDPEAPHVMVEMVSYDCLHCRNMHRIVQRGLKRYGDQLAVLVLVVPLEMKCNSLIKDPKASHPGACTTARMALAVANIKPTAFHSIHDWLMADKEKPPSQVKTVEKAYNMVDSAKLREMTRGDALNKQIAQYVDLFDNLQKQKSGTNKNFGLPVQILGDEVMSGSVEDAEDVYKAWEKNLGVKPL